MLREEPREVVDHDRLRVDIAVEASLPFAVLQHVPQGDPVRPQRLGCRRVVGVTWEPQQLPEDGPERILGMRVVATLPQGLCARHAAEHQDTCCGSCDRRKATDLHHAAELTSDRPRRALALFAGALLGAAGGIESAVCALHDPERALQLQTIWSDSLVDEVADAPSGSFYLVMTHSHDLDLALSERILRRGDHGFFGLIGSATKRARFERRLRDKGLQEASLATLTCPIGLPDIQGKEPAVIAASVVAQLLSRSAPPESR